MHRPCPSSRIPVPPATREMSLITRGAWSHIWGRQACPPLTANHSSLQPGCFAFTTFRKKKKVVVSWLIYILVDVERL